MKIDLMCDNYERAEANRRMVANKQCIAGYLAVEEALMRLPIRSALPSWIPVGELVVMGKSELGNSFHEIGA